MAWLPSVRRQWQSSAFNLAKKASNGFNQSSFVSSTFCNSTRLDNYSTFTSSEAGLGLRGLLSRRTITTGLQSRFAQADRSTTANQKASTSETNDNTANTNATDDRTYRLPEEVKCLAGLGPTKAGEKARVVVLGTGWAGSRLIKGLDTKLYDVVCVSPRNHMVFTPLLASTCVGTLEFRSVAEPISRIQPELSRSPNSYFLLAHCHDINPDSHEIYCETVGENGSQTNRKRQFKVAYDKLIIASGAEALTFGIHGVKEHAIFLREVHHAQEIRRKLLSNLMLSDIPGITEDEKKRLLHCVVVGGGPTGVEFSGELSDFIKKDVHERYSHVKDYIHVTLIEANEILSSFDVGLRQYAIKHLTKSGVQLVRGVVKDVESQKIVLNDGTVVPYGLLIWSTGVGPSSFISSLKLPKSPGGRIGVDDWLRIPSAEDVYAIGDCCGFLESTNRPTLPALAQVAERQGKYLAGHLTRIGKAGGGRAGASKDIPLGQPFVYHHMGSMATVGHYKALVDLRQSKEAKGLSMAGFVSWLVWRSAYLTRTVSWRNRFYVAVNWATTFVFGRDISRI